MPFIRASLLSEYVSLVTTECSVISRREINVNRSPGIYFATEFFKNFFKSRNVEIYLFKFQCLIIRNSWMLPQCFILSPYFRVLRKCNIK